MGLHLLGGLILLRALQDERSLKTADDPAFVWLTLPAATPAVAPSAAPRPAPHAVHRPATPLRAPPASAIVPLVQPATSVQPATNWSLEASQAASDVLAANALDQRRDRAMDSTPVSPYHHAPPRPSFPWSRQPLGKHFDADLHSGVVSLHGKRCMIGLFIILPIFGCDVGHLDPEPGRGDLFDPKYKSQPIEVPRSLSERLSDPQ